MRYPSPRPYEWIDPFEMVESLLDEMNQREEEHEREARHVARACAETIYDERRRSEAIVQKVAEGLAFTTTPPPFIIKER